jgi:hypothetical protein
MLKDRRGQHAARNGAPPRALEDRQTMDEQEVEVPRRNDGSHRIRRLLVRLVEELVAEGSLQVVPGAAPATLAEELHSAIARAGGFAQWEAP